MPWKETCAVKERIRFIDEWERVHGHPLSPSLKPLITEASTVAFPVTASSSTVLTMFDYSSVVLVLVFVLLLVVMRVHEHDYEDDYETKKRQPLA